MHTSKNTGPFDIIVDIKGSLQTNSLTIDIISASGCAPVKRYPLKVSEKIDFVNHRNLTKQLLVRNHVRDLIDLGAGLNPQHALRDELGIRQLLIDLGYPESEMKQIVRKKIDVMDFNSILAAIQLFNSESNHTDGKIDAVVSIQNIEHLEKTRGEELLDFVETITRKVIIVETPNGFVNQMGTLENPHQEHKSGWSVQDFRSRGYKVRGTSGLKVLKKNSNKGEYRFRVRGIRLLDALISRIFFIHYFPSICFNLLAFREIR